MPSIDKDSVFLGFTVLYDGAGLNREKAETVFEFIQGGSPERVTSKRIKREYERVVETREEVLDVLCGQFVDKKTPSDPAEREEFIRSEVTMGSVSEDMEEDITSRHEELIEGLLSYLREVLKDKPDADLYEAVASLRENSRKYHSDIDDCLVDRISVERISRDMDLREHLLDVTDDEFTLQTCVDAKGWWDPKMDPIPITVGDNKTIQDTESQLQRVFKNDIDYTEPNFIYLTT